MMDLMIEHWPLDRLVLGAAGAHLMAARQRMILAMPPPAPPG